MKHLISLICAMMTVLFLSAPANAYYVYLEPQGDITVGVGDQITVGVYLYAEENDTIYGWGVSQVFDSTELTLDSYSFASSTIGAIGSVLYTPAENYFGDDYIFLSRYDWSFKGLTVTADTSYLLYTVTYTYNGGTFDGLDVWLDLAYGVDNFISADSNFYEPHPDATTALMVVNSSGADYGAVPIPGALWLLGSGLAAITGYRKSRKR
ncbi:MAG: VPLPA-CTERM sorting domain-containing protein [Syntrophobacteraceae bacterium]